MSMFASLQRELASIGQGSPSMLTACKAHFIIFFHPHDIQMLPPEALLVENT